MITRKMNGGKKKAPVKKKTPVKKAPKKPIKKPKAGEWRYA